MNATLKDLLAQKLNDPLLRFSPVGGGSINPAFKLTTLSGGFFCKVNSATKFPHLFQSEVSGLKLLGQTGQIKTPSVVDYFLYNDYQVLVLEWIEEGSKTESFWKTFGSQMAALHQIREAHFGLDHDNYMGSVPQRNKPTDNWTTFFRDQRLRPLVVQCIGQQLLDKNHQQLFEHLYTRLPDLFEEEMPCLLHGDLWSGNFMCDRYEQPVLIDPAVYYGHRSADLGMTTLFGGFSPLFYQSYQYHYPLPANYAEQWKVCNLYPLLIHLLLFGHSYRSQIDRTLKEFA
jgi:protein-ribulosamine 3-kinase